MEDRTKREKDKKILPQEYRQSILLFLRFSGWIIGPVIIGLIIGKWLDNKYDTAPFLFLATIGMAFIVSMIGIIRGAMMEYKKIDNSAKQNDKNYKE